MSSSSLFPCLLSMLSQYAQQFFCVSIMENYRTININRGRGVPHFIQILFLVPCAQRYSVGLENKLPPMLHLHANPLNFKLQRHLNYSKLHKMTKFLGKCSINWFPSKKEKVVRKQKPFEKLNWYSKSLPDTTANSSPKGWSRQFNTWHSPHLSLKSQTI